MDKIFLWFSLNSQLIIISLLSSFLFLFIIFAFFRPWFYISKKISYDEGIFRFKIINLTIFKIIDFKLYLRKNLIKDAYPSGQNVFYEPLEIDTKGFIYIPGSLSGLFSKQRPNCIQINVRPHDIKAIIEKDGTHIDIVVMGRHGVTNLCTSKRKIFKHVACVKEGAFESGFSTKIIKR